MSDHRASLLPPEIRQLHAHLGAKYGWVAVFANPHAKHLVELAATALGRRMGTRRKALNGSGTARKKDEPSMTLAQLSTRMKGAGKRDASTLSGIENGDIMRPPTAVITSLESALALPSGTLERLVDRK